MKHRVYARIYACMYTYITSTWYNHQGPGYLWAIIQRQNRGRRESRGQSCEGVASPGEPGVGGNGKPYREDAPEGRKGNGGDHRRDMTRRSTDLLWTNRSRFLSLFTCQVVRHPSRRPNAPRELPRGYDNKNPITVVLQVKFVSTSFFLIILYDFIVSLSLSSINI